MASALAYPAVVIFPALMALSASMDLLTYTIPNRICGLVALGYLGAAAALGVPIDDILLNISCALAVLAIGFAMFSLGWIGGGDAKLATATALWLGWGSVLEYAIATAIYGGILTLTLLGARMMPLPALLNRYGWIVRLHDPKAGVPYGIALAAAGLMQYPNTHFWAMAGV